MQGHRTKKTIPVWKASNIGGNKFVLNTSHGQDQHFFFTQYKQQSYSKWGQHLWWWIKLDKHRERQGRDWFTKNEHSGVCNRICILMPLMQCWLIRCWFSPVLSPLLLRPINGGQWKHRGTQEFQLIILWSSMLT